MTSSISPDAAAPDAGTTIDEVTSSLPDPANLSDPGTQERDQLALQAVRGLARAFRLLERASDELSLAHYRVLSAIASGDVRATRIAARLAVGKPAISAAVESLCQRGLLARSVVEGDQRAAALNLTPAGHAVLDRVETSMTAQLSTLAPHVPDAEQLYRSLAWLDAAIEADLATQA